MDTATAGRLDTTDLITRAMTRTGNHRPSRVSDNGSSLEVLQPRARIKELTRAAIGGAGDTKYKLHEYLKKLPKPDQLNVMIV